jgi:hypothetical protein
MAIATLDAFKDAHGTQREIISVNLTSSTAIAGRVYDTWRASVPLGATPATSVAPTSATLGALGQLNPATGQLSIIGARFSALNPGVYLICDRLSHSGGPSGLSAIVTGAQTTFLPTAPIPRGTGVGVMMGLTIYTQIGATATTVSASYTNTVPTAGRITPLVAFGGTGFREANRMILLPRAEGDVGVNSVQSVTVTATTGTAGVFGVTLFRPLFAILVSDTSGVLSAGGLISGNTAGGIPAIPDNACLFALAVMAGTNTMGCGALLLSEN